MGRPKTQWRARERLQLQESNNFYGNAGDTSETCGRLLLILSLQLHQCALRLALRRQYAIAILCRQKHAKQSCPLLPRRSALFAERSGKKPCLNILREQKQPDEQPIYLPWPVCRYKVQASEIGKKSVTLPKQHFTRQC